MKKENQPTSPARRLIAVFCLTCLASLGGTMASCSEGTASKSETVINQPTKPEGQYLGGLSPDEALSYMKATSNLLILDVRETEWYEGASQFNGNVHIPYSELAERCREIPSDRPVILNCGLGMVAPRAYQLLKEIKADIQQLSYIDGSPRFREYNQWITEQKQD